MTINTKFNVGQWLFFIDPETMKIQSGDVYKIDTEHKITDVKINYWFCIDSKYIIVSEDKTHATREELLESL
jgi:hypothetical protein